MAATPYPLADLLLLAAAIGRVGGVRNNFPSLGFYYCVVSIASKGEVPMLGWAVTFLIVALIAAVLGFGGIAGVAVEAAKIIFFVAIVLFAISAVVALFRGRSPTVS
jgi:uncharacterized membrane protein YtjA (UPF0391 family)